MTKEIQSVLLSKEKLAEIVLELGKQISRDYQGKNLLVVGLLKGSFIFLSDLLREITVPCEVDFMSASSYGSGVSSSGKVTIAQDLERPLKGFDILLTDDILDSGITLSYIVEHLQKQGPASIRTCVLLDKPERRTAAIKADYVGCTVPDEFVVGYGLDYDEKYRNLPYVGILNPEVYTKR